MPNSNNLGFAYVEQAQAQKEVTVNEALERIDGVLNRGVIDKDLTTAPGSPAEGDLYIVAASATGDWAGQSGNLALYHQGWQFIAPKEGSLFWVNDENKLYVYDGAAWILAV